MTTAKAIIVVEEGKRASIQDVPIPKIRDEWILVKPKAVGLNPTDWKHIDLSYADAGAKLGCDYAGVVVEVGSKVTRFKEGDRVAGFCHGGHRLDHETGTFGDYVLAKENAQILIPDDVSFEQAAALPVAFFTCGLGLFKSLGIPTPRTPAKEPFPILINGGSTGTGMLGIQLAKLSGLTVITTSSPHNFEYLKSLGADAVFDYRSPTVGADINKFTHNKLTLAWDCASGGEVLCATALSSTEPSKYGAIAHPNPELLKVNPMVEGPLNVVAYNVVGEVWLFKGETMRPPVVDGNDGTTIGSLWEELLRNKALKPTRIEVNRTGEGLEGVMKGLDELRRGNVSATKLVYTL